MWTLFVTSSKSFRCWNRVLQVLQRFHFPLSRRCRSFETRFVQKLARFGVQVELQAGIPNFMQIISYHFTSLLFICDFWNTQERYFGNRCKAVDLKIVVFGSKRTAQAAWKAKGYSFRQQRSPAKLISHRVSGGKWPFAKEICMNCKELLGGSYLCRDLFITQKNTTLWLWLEAVKHCHKTVSRRGAFMGQKCSWYSNLSFLYVLHV